MCYIVKYKKETDLLSFKCLRHFGYAIFTVEKCIKIFLPGYIPQNGTVS